MCRCRISANWRHSLVVPDAKYSAIPLTHAHLRKSTDVSRSVGATRDGPNTIPESGPQRHFLRNQFAAIYWHEVILCDGNGDLSRSNHSALRLISLNISGASRLRRSNPAHPSDDQGEQRPLKVFSDHRVSPLPMSIAYRPNGMTPAYRGSDPSTMSLFSIRDILPNGSHRP